MTTRVQLLESINYKEKTWASKLSKVNRASARERGVRKRRRKLRRDQLLPLIACSPRARSQALSNHRESRPARARSVASETTRLQVLLDGTRQRALGNGTNHGVHLLTSLENHHRRDGSNAILRRDARALIRVQLHLRARERETHKTRRRQSSSARTQPRNVSPKSTTRAIATRITQHTYRLELPRVLLRELINQRRNHAARSAPRRPEINQHRHVALQHLGIERRIGHHGGERAYDERNGWRTNARARTIDDGRFVMNRPPHDRRRGRVVVARARSVSRSPTRDRRTPTSAMRHGAHIIDAFVTRRATNPPPRAPRAWMIFLPIHRAHRARAPRATARATTTSIARARMRIASPTIAYLKCSSLPRERRRRRARRDASRRSVF